MRSSQTTEPGGVPGDSSYSFSLKGVDKHELSYLNQIQKDALDTLSWGTKQARQEMSPEQIKNSLEDDPYAAIPVIGGADPKAEMVASAKSPQQILAALWKDAEEFAPAR